MDLTTAPNVPKEAVNWIESITPNPVSKEELSSKDSNILLQKSAKVFAEKMENKKKRRKKKWKKPKDKPSRPLSAYNLFFQSERALMLGNDAPTPAQESLKKRVHCKTHGKIGFADMARMIGGKWKFLEPGKRTIYEDQAKVLKKLYATDLASWKEAQKDKSIEGEINGLHAMATAAMASDPIKSDKSSCDSQPDLRPSDLTNAMVPDGIHRRNLFRPQNISFLRSLHGNHHQVDRAAFLGLSNLDVALLKYEYPNAAEASATAILQHFQGGIHQSPLSPGSPPHQLLDMGRLPQLAAYPANVAAMRRLQRGLMPGNFGHHI